MNIPRSLAVAVAWAAACPLVVSAAGAPVDLLVTAVGSGTAGFAGDGATATLAQLNSPTSAAYDSAGNLYIADAFNNRIRKVTPGGIITTVAGTGDEGDSGDNGPALGARLAVPFGVAVDAASNLYIADTANNRIRKVTPGGIITTVAGNGVASFGGDNGSATAARLNGPSSVALGPAGDLFIADTGNNRIRKVTPGGIITTVAGNGTTGSNGDGGAATSAQLNSPSDVSLDTGGALYIADVDNNRIRKVAPDGVISTIMGTGTAGFAGDNGPATLAQLNSPSDVAVDLLGNVFVADTANHRIRKVTPNGVATTVAGNGSPGYVGENLRATTTRLAGPSGVAIDPAGILLIVDTDNHRLRRMVLGTAPTDPTTAPTVPRKGGLTATRLASQAKLTVPKGAKVTLSVAKTSARFCAVRASKLVSLRAGSCRLTVTVKPPKGKPKKATITLKTQ